MFQVGPSCYASAFSANAAAASSQMGTIVEHGGSPYVVTASEILADSISYTLTPVFGGTAVTSVVTVDPVPCGLLTIEDVQPLVWAVVAGWLAVYVILLLWRSAHYDA